MTAQDQAPSSKIYFTIFATLLLLQFMLVAISFPLSDLLTEKPLFYSDGGIHWYRMKLAVNLAATGNLVGYDPFFNAGTPNGLTYNPGSQFPAVLAIVLNPWVSEIRVWKLYSFACAILGPVCVFLALCWCRLGTKGLLIGSAFGIILWWASIFRWYHTNGLVAFVMVSYLALPYMVKILLYLRGFGGWKALIALGLVGAVGMFIHPLFPFTIFFGTLIYLLVSWRNLAWRRVLLLIVVPILSLLPNLFWLYPAFFTKLSEELYVGFYQRVVDINLIWQEMVGLWQGNSHGSKLYGLLAFATVWGCMKGSDLLDKSILYTFTFLGFFLMFLAYVGAVTIAQSIEPNRFAPVGYLFLIIPGTVGVLVMWRNVFEARSAFWRIGARMSLMILAIIGLYNINEVRREVSYANIGHYGVRPPEVRPLGEYSRWVLDWLVQNTTDSARVLFETSKGRIYDGSRMAGYYAYTSGREFIGGPYPFEHFAGFWDGWLFNRPIAAISGHDFKKYMELYNIGWIIVHSAESKRYVEQQPGVVLVSQFKELNAYKINHNFSYFLEGGGHVEEHSHNKVLLSDVSGDSVVMKYHYIRGLESKPATTIIPIKIMDDPNPFVKILNPPSEVVLYLP